MKPFLPFPKFKKFRVFDLVHDAFVKLGSSGKGAFWKDDFFLIDQLFGKFVPHIRPLLYAKLTFLSRFIFLLVISKPCSAHIKKATLLVAFYLYRFLLLGGNKFIRGRIIFDFASGY